MYCKSWNPNKIPNQKYLDVKAGCTGGDSCCTNDNKCGEAEGDCDSDSDCLDGLKCGYDNCQPAWTGMEWDETDDCCYDPTKSKLHKLVYF